MTRRLLAGLCAGILACMALPVAADDSIARVETWMRSVKTLSADFVQVVRGRDGQITDRASGTLALSRPDRFRWDYRSPNVQVIVADGSKLWLYDADLEQVTVRPLQAGLGSTPAMLLSGSGSVGDSFTAGPVERDGEWTWCRLVPKDSGSDFEGVGLGFDTHGSLVAMQLVDKLGQSTELAFAHVKVNAKLDGGLFVFVPPQGADVIGGQPK
jgi:outer membrane lipoprotein carrier protein